MNLSVDIAGLKLKNPVLTASGTFGYGLEFAAYGDLSALGGIVVKGLSLAPREGNPMPRIAETPCGMLNSIGLQNCGVEKFISEKLPYLPWRDTAVIANLYACSADEFAELAGILAAEEGVAALEVNISCPNVAAGGSAFGQDARAAAGVTGAVKRKAGSKPVIVKLSPNVTSIKDIAKAVAEAGCDAISLINTVTGMSVDLRSRKPRLARVIGGLSGPAIKPVALRCLYEARQVVDVPLIGLGGIASAEDALEFILVGASAVQVGTANFMSPDFSFKLVEAIPKLMEELKISDLNELRGTLKV